MARFDRSQPVFEASAKSDGLLHRAHLRRNPGGPGPESSRSKEQPLDIEPSLLEKGAFAAGYLRGCRPGKTGDRRGPEERKGPEEAGDRRAASRIPAVGEPPGARLARGRLRGSLIFPVGGVPLGTKRIRSYPFHHAPPFPPRRGVLPRGRPLRLAHRVRRGPLASPHPARPRALGRGGAGDARRRGGADGGLSVLRARAGAAVRAGPRAPAPRAVPRGGRALRSPGEARARGGDGAAEPVRRRPGPREHGRARRGRGALPEADGALPRARGHAGRAPPPLAPVRLPGAMGRPRGQRRPHPGAEGPERARDDRGLRRQGARAGGAGPPRRGGAAGGARAGSSSSSTGSASRATRPSSWPR